jgi:hypothetical protein
VVQIGCLIVAVLIGRSRDCRRSQKSAPNNAVGISTGNSHETRGLKKDNASLQFETYPRGKELDEDSLSIGQFIVVVRSQAGDSGGSRGGKGEGKGE